MPYHRKHLLRDERALREIDQPWKAYLLGWIYSDGCMERGSTRMRIALGEKDAAVLDYLASMIFSTPYTLGHRKPTATFSRGKHYTSQPQKVLSVSCRPFYEDLLAVGLTPAKSLTIAFPTAISERFLPDFVRGHFEGDGCIRIRQNGCPNVSITCSGPFADGLRAYLSLHGIRTTRLKEHGSGSIYVVNIYDYESVFTFYKLIYPGTEPFALKRKRDIFETAYANRFRARGSNRTSQYCGVCFKPKIKRWIARVTVDSKRYNVGCYLTEQAAFEARVEYLQKRGLHC